MKNLLRHCGKQLSESQRAELSGNLMWEPICLLNILEYKFKGHGHKDPGGFYPMFSLAFLL